jgi:superfamily II DNA or RNA helicase
VQLRDYQEAALAAARAAYDRGVHRAMICLATGLGKTVIIAGLPHALGMRAQDAMVVVVNRDELVGQTIDKLTTFYPTARIGIEKAERRATGHERFIVASIQTLQAERRADFLRRLQGRIAVLVIDECHHATAQSYVDLIDVFSAARTDGFVLGVTATPQRADGQGLGSVFEEIVFHRDVRWAIENGYLVPLRCYKVATATSLDALPHTTGDFPMGQLGRTIDTPNRNDLIVSAYLSHTRGKKAIAFCATIAQAEHLCAAFRGKGVAAAWASGTTSRRTREENVRDFRSGKLNVLVNCGIYVEGFDVPDAEVLIGARPTASASLHIQMTGRVMRPLDDTARRLGRCENAAARRAAIAASAKPVATILDIVDQTNRHSLCTIPSLWGLPAAIDIGGHDPADAAALYRTLVEKAPATAKLMTSYAHVQTTLEALDAFAIPMQDAALAEVSSLNWRLIGPNLYRLALPKRFAATDRTGQPIADFSRRYRLALADAKRKGAHPAEAYARDALQFEPTSFTITRETLEIGSGASEPYEARLESNGNIRVLGSASSLHEIFTRAERWISQNRRDVASSLTTSASWRSRPISARQLGVLKSAFAVPLHLIPETQGDASALISQLIDGRKPGTIEKRTV